MTLCKSARDLSTSSSNDSSNASSDTRTSFWGSSPSVPRSVRRTVRRTNRGRQNSSNATLAGVAAASEIGHADAAISFPWQARTFKTK